MEQPAAAVSVKLPDFWPRSPSTWFAQVEAQFALGHITTDDTKFYHVVAKLDQTTAIKITDLLNNPPETDKYKALKDRLTESHSRTPLERAEALLDVHVLGDRRPSELMDELIALAGTDIRTDCPLFSAIFLRTLPPSVRQHLTVDGKLGDPRAMAKRADHLHRAAPEQCSTVSRISMPHTTKPKKPTGLCFFHQRWGAKAKKCKQPCSYVGNVSAVDSEFLADSLDESHGSGNGSAGRC